MTKEGRNGGTLKPFEPGKSGNPSGRPKGTPNVATRLERFLSAKKTGEHPATGEEDVFTLAELMDFKQIAKALDGDTVAWEKINDRIEGKPAQSVKMDVTQQQQAKIKLPDGTEIEW